MLTIMHRQLQSARMTALTTVTCALLATASGCGGGGESATSAQPEGPTIYNLPDPAMEGPTGPEIARPVKIDVLPVELTLDEEGGRIFVPEMGWLPLDEFWHIYDTNPARFPDSLDYRAVHQIRLSLADKDHDEA